MVESHAPEEQEIVHPKKKAVQSQADTIALLQAQLAEMKQQLAQHEVRLPVPEDRQAIAEQSAVKIDETMRGGLYIKDGVVVNANGKPIPGYEVKNGNPVKTVEKPGKKEPAS